MDFHVPVMAFLSTGLTLNSMSENCLKCGNRLKKKQLKFRVYPANDKLHKNRNVCYKCYCLHYKKRV